MRALLGLVLAAFALVAFWLTTRRNDPPAPPRPGAPPTTAERRAIDAGLDWLAAAQEPEGHWSCSRWSTCGGTPGLPGIGDEVVRLLDPGVTALALLPFLEDGQTPDRGRHAGTVRRALLWLRIQGESYLAYGLPRYANTRPGPWHWGNVAEEYNPLLVYAALAEALRRAGQEELRPTVEAAVRQITSARRPERPWAIALSPYDIGPVVFWVQLLEAAEAAGIEVPVSARAELRAYLEELTEASSGRILNADICPECLGGWDAQAVAVLARDWVDPAKSAVRDLEVATIAAHPPVWQTEWRVPEDELKGMKAVWRCSRDIVNYYYWYYGLLVMERHGGNRAASWRDSLVRALVDHQVRDGPNAGSWEPLDPWGRVGGRVYSTSYAVLSLLASRGR